MGKIESCIVLSDKEMRVLRYLISLGKHYLDEEGADIDSLSEASKKSGVEDWERCHHQVNSLLSEECSDYTIPRKEVEPMHHVVRYGYMDYLNGIGEPCTESEWEELKRNPLFGEVLTVGQRLLFLLSGKADTGLGHYRYSLFWKKYYFRG